MIPGSALPLLIQMLVLTCAVPWPAAVFNFVIWLLFAGAVQLRTAVMHPCTWPIECFAHVLRYSSCSGDCVEVARVQRKVARCSGRSLELPWGRFPSGMA